MLWLGQNKNKIEYKIPHKFFFFINIENTSALFFKYLKLKLLQILSESQTFANYFLINTFKT